MKKDYSMKERRTERNLRPDIDENEERHDMRHLVRHDLPQHRATLSGLVMRLNAHFVQKNYKNSDEDQSS